MNLDDCLIKDCRADKHCSGHACKTCGWNPEVQARRRGHIARWGLKRCSDGLMRLVIKPIKKGGNIGGGMAGQQ